MRCRQYSTGGPHDCYRRPGVARYTSRRGPAREAIGRRPVRDLAESIKKRIETIVSLPAFTDELFPQDIASMLKSRLTFKEAIESLGYSLMSRHRLKVAQREFYSRLDSLAVSPTTSQEIWQRPSSNSCSKMRFVRHRSEPIDGGRGNRSFFVYHSGES